MHRACGLLAAEHRDGGRKRRDERRRHRQARPDDEREQNEDHEHVGEPLQQVIRPGVRGDRPRESEMLARSRGESACQRKIARIREQVFAEMAAYKRRQMLYSAPVNTIIHAA